MTNQRTKYILVAVIVLIVSILACGGSDNTGSKVGTSSDTGGDSAPKVEIYKSGDVIQVKDHTITLNNAKLQSGKLQANFTVENQGSEEVTVSSMLSFSAKDSDGVKLEQDIFDCGSSFDGSVLPGDKLKGDLCWEGATTNSAKIYYEASLFGSGAIVWEVKE